MAKVTVTLDPKSKLLKMNPNPVKIGKGVTETIHWRPAKNSKFKFVALVFDDENPLSSVVVADADITARDNNQTTRDYTYSVVAKDVNNGTYYYSPDTGRMTADTPTIRNN